ncbi:sulfotransferase [Roseobacter sp.]|uniref:sulfotransferase n=1 Tax=Roseobacter sp. TaxID=1907202 RepID=UPI00385B982B
MNAGRKPDIVCIGAQKAGTSWLHETLAKRPDIWVPPFKELHFFDHKFIPECRRWAPWHVKKGLKAARARAEKHADLPDETYLAYLAKLEQPPMFNGTWYKHVFSRAGVDQKCLDITPEYSCIPDVGVDFFKRFVPEVRLIYVIRQPLARLKSQLRMMAQRSRKQPFGEADWQELLRLPAFRMRGDYLSHVPRWDARFSEEQLLYLPFGRIETDPAGLLKRIELHCNLPPNKYPSAARPVHQTQPMPIPDFVLGHFQEHIAAQDRFLKDRFGEGFFDQT